MYFPLFSVTSALFIINGYLPFMNEITNIKDGYWQKVPFSPAKFPFFYGWVIVFAATVGVICSLPGQTVGVGVFTDKLIDALGLSRTQLSLAYMIGTVTSSFLLPFAGSLTDRFGTRKMVVVSSLGLGTSLLVFSNADHITAYFSGAAVVLVITAFLFLLIRFFGQGSLTLVSRIMIGKWFNHRRGLATALSNIAVAYSFGVAPAVLNSILLNTSWQKTYLILAAAVGVGMTLFGWIFFRDNPEDCGLVMDGRSDEDWVQKVSKRVPQTVKNFTRKEAINNFSFWTFALVASWQALLMTAVTFHITSIGEEMQLNREQAYSVFPIIGLVSMFSVITAGWLSDHIRLKWLLQATVISQLFAALGLYDFSAPLGKIIFIGGYAISGGLFGLLLTVTWPRYFGREHLGAISGLVTSMLVFASAIGPIMFSFLRDISESYRLVIILSIAISGLLLVPSLFVKNPQEKLRQSGDD